MPHKHLNDQKLCQKQNLKKKQPIFFKKIHQTHKKKKKKN